MLLLLNPRVNVPFIAMRETQGSIRFVLPLQPCRQHQGKAMGLVRADQRKDLAPGLHSAVCPVNQKSPRLSGRCLVQGSGQSPSELFAALHPDPCSYLLLVRNNPGGRGVAP